MRTTVCSGNATGGGFHDLGTGCGAGDASGYGYGDGGGYGGGYD